MAAVIQYILTSAQTFGSQDYYDKSLMTILGLAGVNIILRKSADIDKMNYRLFRRKYLLGCLGKLGEVSRQKQVKD